MDLSTQIQDLRDQWEYCLSLRKMHPFNQALHYMRQREKCSALMQELNLAVAVNGENSDQVSELILVIKPLLTTLQNELTISVFQRSN